jgi:hypothetical protein
VFAQYLHWRTMLFCCSIVILKADVGTPIILINFLSVLITRVFNINHTERSVSTEADSGSTASYLKHFMLYDVLLPP